MAGFIVKNTFVTLTCEEFKGPVAASRHRSAPPSKRAADLVADEAGTQDRYAAQLSELNEIMSSGAPPSFVKKSVQQASARTFTMSTREPSELTLSKDSALSASDDVLTAHKEPAGSGGVASRGISWTISEQTQRLPADIQALLARIPCDDDGLPTSAGSLGHAEKQCKPCAFMALPFGCKFGFFCDFCHFTTGHANQKVRFCKGKRDRFKKAYTDAEESSESSPPHCEYHPLSVLALPEKTLAKSYARAVLRLNASAPEKAL